MTSSANTDTKRGKMLQDFPLKWPQTSSFWNSHLHQRNCQVQFSIMSCIRLYTQVSTYVRHQIQSSVNPYNSIPILSRYIWHFFRNSKMTAISSPILKKNSCLRFLYTSSFQPCKYLTRNVLKATLIYANIYRLAVVLWECTTYLFGQNKG